MIYSFKFSTLILGALFVISCTNSNDSKQDNKQEKQSNFQINKDETSNPSQYKIALFDNDSLLVKYQYSKDIEEKIRRKERSIIANREAKMKDFQELYNTLNQKLPTMTQLEAQQAEQQLLNKQQELDFEDQQTQQKYIDWKTKILVDYQAHLDSTLENYRKEHNIDILIPSGGGITKFYYNVNLDITNSVIEYLNERFKETKGETK